MPADLHKKVGIDLPNVTGNFLFDTKAKELGLKLPMYRVQHDF